MILQVSKTGVIPPGLLPPLGIPRKFHADFTCRDFAGKAKHVDIGTIKANILREAPKSLNHGPKLEVPLFSSPLSTTYLPTFPTAGNVGSLLQLRVSFHMT